MRRHERWLGWGIAMVFVLITVAARGEGYWQFKGERFVKGVPFRVGPNDPTQVTASGGGNALHTEYSQRTVHSSVDFSWTADSDLAALQPGQKIKFNGKLTHSGDPAGMGNITNSPLARRRGRAAPAAWSSWPI